MAVLNTSSTGFIDSRLTRDRLSEALQYHQARVIKIQAALAAVENLAGLSELLDLMKEV